MIKKPELLAPAGSLDKCKIAILYGADACYVGGSVFGLRKYAENFNLNELKEAVRFANQHQSKIYVVLNGFAHQSDLDNLTRHIPQLAACKPHGFIISDIGVASLANDLCDIPIHASTQASITNEYTAELWKQVNATRVILARETTIEEARQIRDNTNLEVEIFVHGAMCASYSGKCTISNYTSGRDSNRGGCVQTCRHTFNLIDPDTSELTDSATIMNAKDLMAVRLLPQIMKSGLDSIKIEGRMKSHLYVANTISTYRKAIDECHKNLLNHETFNPIPYETQLQTVSNRGFSTGGLEHRPHAESIHYEFTNYNKETDYIGTIKAENRPHATYIEIKQPIQKGDSLILLDHQGKEHTITIDTMSDITEHPIDKAIPNTIVKTPWIHHSAPHMVLKRHLS